jgi:transposase
MWPDIEKIRIYIRPGVTDFRKQINGLTLMARYRMGMDPLSGDLFVFCSRDRRKLKAVYWDRNGFCMWQKRLEKDRFPWPDDEVELRTLSGDELHTEYVNIDFAFFEIS